MSRNTAYVRLSTAGEQARERWQPLVLMAREAERRERRGESTAHLRRKLSVLRREVVGWMTQCDWSGESGERLRAFAWLRCGEGWTLERLAQTFEIGRDRTMEMQREMWNRLGR